MGVGLEIRSGLAAGLVALASPLAAQGVAPIAVPSGGQVTLFETLHPEPATLYVSFVSPTLSGDQGLPYDVAQLDMDALCDIVGLPTAGNADAPIREVVIRLMAEPIPYGEANQQVAQFASVYDITSGDCEWM